jgi:TRAP-type C4-dicarboxylate transport system permease small subunit
MARLVARLGALSMGLAGASLLAMTLLGALDIIGTKFFSRPIPGAYEATEALLVLTVFLALAHAQASGQHIAVDLVVERLGGAPRRVMRVLALALTLGVFAIIAWRGWVLGLGSLAIREYASGIIPFPVYPSKLALAVGATLMVLQTSLDLVVEARDGRDAGTVLPPV